MTNAENCEKCLYTEWPNEARDKCVPKVVEFFSYDTDVVAYVFLFLLALSSTTILLIIGIFIFFWNTSVVRANNRNLSFLILVSLKLSLLCMLLFIGKPVDTTCMLRHICFGIIFTVILSSILAKTIMVCIAFKATTPNSSWRKWIGVKLPNAIVMILSSLQVLNGIVWLSLSPPFQEIDMDSTPGKIIIQCNEGSRLAFYFMLGYMGFLAVMSLILAFMVRKLPDIYNEAKYITFSMLVFFSVWICAIPAYLSSKGKNMVSVEVFAILASGNGILICIFLPKLWNILTKSEMRTSIHQYVSLLVLSKTINLQAVLGFTTTFNPGSWKPNWALVKRDEMMVELRDAYNVFKTALLFVLENLQLQNPILSQQKKGYVGG
ncbi:vomeronasal type-2 receptor 26-like [Anomaloglossus baeobatrachus]